MHLHADLPPHHISGGAPALCRTATCDGEGAATADHAETLERTLQAMQRHNLAKGLVSRLGAMGEIGTQLSGVAPNDPALEPYFALAEEFEVPILIYGRHRPVPAHLPVDMRAAVQTFVQRKFGPGGAYDPNLGGPWKENRKVKASVSSYRPNFVDC